MWHCAPPACAGRPRRCARCRWRTGSAAAARQRDADDRRLQRRALMLSRYSAARSVPRFTTSKSSSGRQEFDANVRMIRPSWPTTAVASVWVTSPLSSRYDTPKNRATSSHCGCVAGDVERHGHGRHQPGHGLMGDGHARRGVVARDRTGEPESARLVLPRRTGREGQHEEDDRGSHGSVSVGPGHVSVGHRNAAASYLEVGLLPGARPERSASVAGT